MKPKWNEPLTKGELDLLFYKFIGYLGSVGRKIQNDRLKNLPYRGE